MAYKKSNPNGQATMANSEPIVFASDQSALPVSGTFFQATQPVSGPLTDTQLRAVAVPVSGAFFQATQPVSGTFFQTTQPVSLATAPVTAVTDNAGSLTVDAPVGTPAFVRLSDGTAAIATLPVSLATAPTTPVTGTFWQATQPVSIATNTPDVTDRAARLLGVVASITNALPVGANVIGALTANQSVNNAQIAGVATSVGSGVSGTGVQRVVLATDVIQPAVSEIRAATLHVTVTAAVNTAATASLPAPAAGLFHYITSIQVVKLYSVIGVAAGAGVILTSTNLPGTPAWTTEQLALAAGSATTVLNYQPTTPLKCAVAATITTVAAPAQLQTIWRINVSYFTA